MTERHQGATVILVTHGSDMPAYARRTIHLRDDVIESDQNNDGAA